MSAAGRLFGAKAVVFGTANGIGDAIARMYTQHAAQVLAVDDVDSGIEQQFAALAEVTALPLPADEWTAAIDTARRELGGVDVIVDCYALQPDVPFADEAALRLELDARLGRARALFDRALPLLQKSPSGRVLFIGYTRSVFAPHAEVLVELAEQALAQQARELAASTGKDGITVNYIQPGAVMTADSRRIFTADKDFRDRCIRASASARLGDPIDIAKVALFLASDDAAFVSGTGIRVDGGQVE